MKIFISTLMLVLIITGAVTFLHHNNDVFAAGEAIECNGDQVEYFKDEKKIVGSGDVVILYKDMKLTCDKVTVWTETQQVLAEGNALLTQGESSFGGAKITYNFKDNTGDIVDFKGNADEWYVYGKSAERLGEEKFIASNSYITTCEHKVPHWKISAERIDVYPERMVNTYNAVFWANPFSIKNVNIPLMWLPYYCHPLDDDRPHVTLIPGKSSDWGAYLLTAWRYNLTPNHKGYVHLDYREKKDAAIGLEHIYDTEMFGKGNFFAYYMNERTLGRDHFWDKWYKSEKNDTEATTELEKGIVRLRHQWQMTPKTLITAELHKYKDESLLKDYFFNTYEKDENPLSYLLATHSLPFGVLSILTQKRVNRFQQVTELLPEAKLNINSQRIGESKFYYSGNFKAVNMNTVYPRHTDDDPGTIIDQQHANIYDLYNQLSYVTKLGFLSINPYAGTKQTYLDREVDNKSSIINGTAYAGINLSTKFYKIFNVEAAPLGIEINRLRHIVTPTLSYEHIAPSTVPSEKMLSESVTRSNKITIGLENKLQTKAGPGSDQLVDLAMLLVETSYDFKKTPGGQLNDYTAKLELRPYSWLTATSDAVIDPHKLESDDHEWLKSLTNSVSFSFGKKASLGIGHTYQSGANNLLMQAKLDFIPGWRFSIYEDFDFLGSSDGDKKINDLKEQEYVITKDLHCWELDLRYNVTRDGGEEVMLVFRLKAFPEIPFEFGKSYHKPKIGARS